MRPHHLALKVKNLEACEQFYRDLLGLPVDSHQPHSVWLTAGDLILMLEKTEHPIPARDETPGFHLFALRITASERLAWKDKFAKAGVPITGESPYSLYFNDPEGNRLALSHYPERAI